MRIDVDLTDVERIEKELDDVLGPGFQSAQGGEAARPGFPGGIPGQRPSEKELREDWASKTKAQKGGDIVKAATDAWRQSGRP